MPSLRDVYRVVIVHAAEQLPFGPFVGGISASVFSTGHQLLHEVDATWTVSEAIKDYACEYGRLQTIFLVHHPWTYLDERTHSLPPAQLNWEKEYVGMIDPSPVKVSKIFLGLARCCPQFKFAVWCGWGSDSGVQKELEAPNIVYV